MEFAISEEMGRAIAGGLAAMLVWYINRGRWRAYRQSNSLDGRTLNVSPQTLAFLRELATPGEARNVSAHPCLNEARAHFLVEIDPGDYANYVIQAKITNRGRSAIGTPPAYSLKDRLLIRVGLLPREQ